MIDLLTSQTKTQRGQVHVFSTAVNYHCEGHTHTHTIAFFVILKSTLCNYFNIILWLGTTKQIYVSIICFRKYESYWHSLNTLLWIFSGPASNGPFFSMLSWMTSLYKKTSLCKETESILCTSISWWPLSVVAETSR